MEQLAAGDPAEVGGYRLRARLGSGGMGRVYLGSAPGGRVVAVKVVHPELARDAEFLRRFRDEVAAAGAVSGIYTAPVYAADLDGDPPWLATVFVPGPTLQQAVEEHGPLSQLALWRLAVGLSEALGAIHASGLVHRDLKPTNVLLAEDGPRVIDFGISRALEGTALTSTGMIIGSAPFMSPEQAEGGRVTAASDVFSLGAVLCFAAAGAPPFGEGSAAAILYRVVHAQPDVSAIPVPLREIVASCLAKHAADRPSLAELSRTLLDRGPEPEDRAAAFWPAGTEDVIRQYRAGLGTALSLHPATQPGPAATLTSNRAASTRADSPAVPTGGTPARPGAIRSGSADALRIAVTIAVLAIIAAGSYYLSSSGAGSHHPAPAAVARHTLSRSHASSPSPAVTTSPSPAAQIPRELVLRLAATQECWVELVMASSRTPILEGDVYPGYSETWTETKAVTVSLGNPPGVILTVNGHRVSTDSTDPVSLSFSLPRNG